MFLHVTRLAPAAAAASLYGVCQSGSFRKSFKPRPGSCPLETVSLSCDTASNIPQQKDDAFRHKTVRHRPKPTWGLLGSVPGEQSEKTLLGQSRWVYRLLSSEKVSDVYEIKGELGEGAFSRVFLGRHKAMGFYRALKKIPKGEDIKNHEAIKQELYSLMDLDHPNIIKLVRVYDDGDNFYIVSDLCTGPSLLDRLMKGSMTEEESGVTMRHMLKAVSCCHSHYMGHYDIKPENFMFSGEDCKKLKMIDLGLSSGFKRDPSEFKGTVAYTAPEVFFGMYGPEADVWSCGVVLFAMTTGQSLCPMKAEDDKVVELLKDRNWMKKQLKWASRKVSAECFDLLCKMLCYDRHMRITAADALTHPFIANRDSMGEYIPGHKMSRSQDKKDEEAAVMLIRSMATSFVEFGTQPVLVRAALYMMVLLRGYTAIETRIHRLAYSMLDKMGSGELSMDLIEAMLPRYGMEIPANLDVAFKAVDLNQTGYITYGNFLSAMLPVSLRCREDLLKRAFKLLDQNRDGFIDQDDLVEAFLTVDKKMDKHFVDLCREAIIEITGSDERVDFDQFQKAVAGSTGMVSSTETEPFEGR